MSVNNTRNDRKPKKPFQIEHIMYESCRSSVRTFITTINSLLFMLFKIFFVGINQAASIVPPYIQCALNWGRHDWNFKIYEIEKWLNEEKIKILRVLRSAVVIYFSMF